MSVIRRKKLALTFLTLVLLGAATLAAFYLLQQNQDTRRQAQVCDPSNPHCKTPSSSGDSGQGTTNPDLSKKGIVATTFSGTRPSTQAACSAGVWMNNFCYMPGDEFAGGKVVVASGRYNYPYIEDKKTYENINFEAASINRNLGSTTSLGEDCGGQGMAISGICYAYGATVNGYVVMPQRISGCDNATGNYCYPHLKKIETSYSDWQKAVGAYQETGALTELENLYKKLYGTNFVADNLFDSKAPNADLLRAQALITALTNAAIIKEQAASQNAALQAKGNLTAAEQATFNYNASILADANLHLRYQAIDQLGASAANSLTTEAALNRMYNSLVVADASELNRIATDKFKEIFGYDPMTKYNNLDGILNAIGLDVASLNQDRAVYAANVAAATAKQEQDVKRVNDEYQKFLNGESTSIAGLRQAAVAAGVVTTSQLSGLSDAETLAVILAGFSGQPLSKARQEAQTVLDLKARIAKEKELMTSYAESLKNNDGGDPGSLYALYEFYTGTKLTGRVSDAWLKSEISKHNQQFALLAFQQDLNPTYLENSYQANREIGLSPDERMPTNERVLLKELYGEEIGEEVYFQSVLPVKLQAAAVNFAVDGGAAFRQVCNEVGLSNCRVDSSNAIDISNQINVVLYQGRTNAQGQEFNIPEMTTALANQISVGSQEAKSQTGWELFLARQGAYGMAKTNNATFGKFSAETASVFEEVDQLSAAYRIAVDSTKVFDTYQTYAYAREYQDQISATTFGLAYGNALMNDNLLNRRFDLGAPTYPLYNQAAASSTPSTSATAANNLGLTRNQALGLSFYQVGTQVFGMTTPAQDIASNYATAARDNYTGPAGTYLSNLAMTGARNIGLVDEYQTVSLGYYNDPVSSIKAAGAYVGAVMATNRLNAATAGFNPYEPQAAAQAHSSYIDPYEYAKAEAAKTKTALLYDRYVAGSNTDLEALTAFRSDAEIQRSAAALKYETIEKVVVPVTAPVLLGTAVLSGAAPAVFFGLASSQFSLYQGAGMKAQALELQRYDIETRRYAAVEMARAEGASEQEIAQLEQDIADQVKVLNNQGNLMLVSSAVAGFMGFGGWASGAANASQLAGISNNLVSATAKTGLVLTRMGQVSGIGLNTYNFGTSSLGAYQAFAAGDSAEGWNNTLVAATALTGVFGNANNLRGLQTSGTHKLDFWADLTGAVTGTSTDVMQIQAACGNDSGAFDQRQCMNAWIGLALSAGMDVNQISSSHRLVRGDQQTARLGELNAQLDVVDAQILALRAVGGAEPAKVKQLALLEARHRQLATEITTLNPNAKINQPNSPAFYAETRKQVLDKLVVDFEQAVKDGKTETVKQLTAAIGVFNQKTGQVEALTKQIADIDQRISQEGIILRQEEIDELQANRKGLVGALGEVVRDLEVIESMQIQHAAILRQAEENVAMAAHQALVRFDETAARYVAGNAPAREAVDNYRQAVQTAGATQLESDPARRLLSVAALEDNLTNLQRLRAEQTARQAEPDSPGKTADLEKLAADISSLERLVEGATPSQRSLPQRIIDGINPFGRSARQAYYDSLDLTLRVNALEEQRRSLAAGSDELKNLDLELAATKRRLLAAQQAVTRAAAEPQGLIARYLEQRRQTAENRRQIDQIKKLSTALGTKNIELTKQITERETALAKLKAEGKDNDDTEVMRLETELAELRHDSILRGSERLVDVDQSGQYTVYKVNDKGREAGLDDEQLRVFNEELKAYEVYQQASIPGFKIYSNTGSFKDQDVFLFAELESFAASLSGGRGHIYPALPGMGKTEVVIPFNVVLRMVLDNKATGKPQFMVFSEPKLMKPWTLDADYTRNESFISYVQSRIGGEGSVLIVRSSDQNISSAEIAQAKIIVTTRDVAFKLDAPDTEMGRALADKWSQAHVTGDEVHQTFDPNLSYRSTTRQTAIKDKPEFALYEAALRKIVGIDGDGQVISRGLNTLADLIDFARNNRAIPEGITRTSDDKSGQFADANLEKQVLGEWLDTWGGRSKIADLDMAGDVGLIRQAIDRYVTSNADPDARRLRAELATINNTVTVLSRVPGEDYGLSSQQRLLADGQEETINSIAPKDQNKDTGRSYGSVAEQLIYNTLGARIIDQQDQINISKLTVGEGGSDINYAALLLRAKSFSLYTGTPETLARLLDMTYGVKLKSFSDSAIADVVARFKASNLARAEISRVFVSLADQVSARLGELSIGANGRNPVYVNMAAGMKNNDVVLAELAQTVKNAGDPAEIIFRMHADGSLIEYRLGEAGQLTELRRYPTANDLNARTAELDLLPVTTRYLKFYDFGAHVGVDTYNRVDLSRAVGICNGCDETTFAQGINRLRVQIENGKAVSAPMDVIWLDVPANLRAQADQITIDDFAAALRQKQEVNEALIEVAFKETLLRNAINDTYAELIELTKNGKRGWFGITTYRGSADLAADLEQARQIFKETSEMNYSLDSVNLSAQAKLAKTAEQVRVAYEDLTRLLAGSGEPARVLALRADGATGNNPIRVEFESDTGYQPLSATPSYRQVVELINKSSLRLNDTNVAFSDRRSSPELVQQELAAANQNRTDGQTGDDGTTRPGPVGPDGGSGPAAPNAPAAPAVRTVADSQNAGLDQNQAPVAPARILSGAGLVRLAQNAWHGTFGDKERARLLEEQAEQVIVEQSKLQAQLEEERTWLRAELANASPALTEESLRNLNASLQEIDRQLEEANLHTAAELAVIEQHQADYTTGGLRQWASSQLRQLTPTRALAGLSQMMNAVWDYTADGEMSDLEDYMAAMVDDEEQAAARMGGVFERVATWWQNQSRQDSEDEKDAQTAGSATTVNLTELFFGKVNLDRLRQEQKAAIDQEATKLFDEQAKIQAEIKQLEEELAGTEVGRQQQITARLSSLQAQFIAGDDDQVLAVIQERALANVAARAGFTAREGGWLRQLWGDQRSQGVAYSIGRSVRNSLQVVPLLRNISNRHAQVIYGPNGTLLLRDLDSKFGTFLNGVRLPALTDTELKEGDRFVLSTAATLAEEVAFVVRRNENGQLVISSTQPAFLVDTSQLSWGPFLVRQFWGVARPVSNYFIAAVVRNMTAYQEGLSSTEQTWGLRLGEWAARRVNWAQDKLNLRQRLVVLFNDPEEILKKERALVLDALMKENGELLEGQVLKYHDAFYQVIKGDEGFDVKRVLSFRKTNPWAGYNKLSQSYTKEYARSYVLANNFPVKIWWDEAKKSYLILPHNFSDPLELSEKPLIFTNGLSLTVVDDQLELDWYSDQISLDRGQTISVDWNGNLILHNKEFAIGDSRMVPNLYYDGKLYTDQADINLEVGKRFVTHTGNNRAITINQDGQYVIERLDSYSNSKTEELLANLKNELENDSVSRIDLLNFVFDFKGQAKSKEEIEEIANDKDNFFRRLNELIGISVYSSFPSHNLLIQTNSTLDGYKFNYLIYQYLLSKNTSFAENIEQQSISQAQSIIDRLNFTIDEIRFQGENGGLASISVLTYLKNIEKLRDLYLASVSMSEDDFSNYSREILADFDQELVDDVFSEFEGMQKANPYSDQNSTKRNYYSLPYSNVNHNQILLDIIEARIPVFLKDRFINTISLDSESDPFITHQSHMTSFWDMAFEELGVERPVWFSPYQYKEADQYDYHWQHSTSETTIANAGGSFFLYQIFQMTGNLSEIEHLLNHEAVHNTYLKKGESPRQSKTDFPYEELTTDLLAQMITRQSLDIPPKNLGSYSYQGGVNRLIELMEQIDASRGKNTAVDLLIRGVADYGNNLAKNPLEYLEETYNELGGANFDESLRDFSDDILRTDPTNLLESPSLVEDFIASLGSLDQPSLPPSLSRQGLGIIHPVVGQGLLQSQAANPAATTHQVAVQQYRIMNFVYNQHLPDELQDLIPVEVQRELAVRLNNAYLQANPWVVLAQKNVDVHTVFLDLQPNREISLHLLTDFIRYQARAIIEQTLKEHGIDLPGEVQLHQFLRVGVSLDPEKALTFSLLQRNFAQQLPPGLETLFGALSGLMEVPEKLLSGDHLPIIEQVSDKESAELIQPIVGKNVELLGRMLSWGDHSAISGDLMTEVVASQSLPNFTDAQVAEWSQYSFDSYFTIAKVLELLTPEQQAQFGQQVLEIDFGEDTHLSPVTLDLGESLTGVVDITPYSDIANQMTGSAASPTEAQALLDGFRTINLHWQAQATALFADSPEIGINEYSGDGFKLILLGRPSAATLAKLLSLNESYAQALQAARAGQLGPAAQAAAEFIAERFSDKLFVKVALNAGPAALRFYAQNQFGYIATELLTEADLDGLMKQSKDYKKANGINTAVMAISASVATEYAADELAAEGLEIVEMEGRLFVRRITSNEGSEAGTTDQQSQLKSILSRNQKFLNRLQSRGVFRQLGLTELTNSLQQLENLLALIDNKGLFDQDDKLRQRLLKLAKSLAEQRKVMAELEKKYMNLLKQRSEIDPSLSLLGELGLNLSETELRQKITVLEAEMPTLASSRSLREAKKAAISRLELSQEDHLDIYQQVQEAIDLEEVENIIVERLERYAQLERQLALFSFSEQLVINNENFYQQQLKHLAAKVAQIEELQSLTSLRFVRLNDQGRVPIDAKSGDYVLELVGDFENWDDFWLAAEEQGRNLSSQIEINKEGDGVIDEINSLLQELESSVTVELMSLTKVNASLIRINLSTKIIEARSDAEKQSLLDRLNQVNELLARKRDQLIGLRQELRVVIADHDRLSAQKLMEEQKFDLNEAEFVESIGRVKQLIEELKNTVSSQKNTFSSTAKLIAAKNITSSLFSRLSSQVPASQEVYEQSLIEATRILSASPGLVELSADKPVITISDLHARGEFLLNALNSTIETAEGKLTVLEAMARDLVVVVALGDGLHSEDADRWKKMNTSNFAQDPYMSLEMARALDMMKAIMELKTSFPNNFHFLKGNHDDATVSLIKHNINQAMATQVWMKSNFGVDFFEHWKAFEQSLPLLAVQKNASGLHKVFTHAAPKLDMSWKNDNYQDLSLAEIFAKSEYAYLALTWGDNTPNSKQAKFALTDAELRNNVNALLRQLGLDPDKTTWVVGHRPVDRDDGSALYRTQLDNRLLQINSASKHTIAITNPGNSTTLVRDVNPTTARGVETLVGPNGSQNRSVELPPARPPAPTEVVVDRHTRIKSMKSGEIYVAQAKDFTSLAKGLKIGRNHDSHLISYDQRVGVDHLRVFYQQPSLWQRMFAIPVMEGWLMTDMGSANGTISQKNYDQHLEKNKPYRVVAGDILKLSSALTIRILTVDAEQIRFELVDDELAPTSVVSARQSSARQATASVVSRMTKNLNVIGSIALGALMGASIYFNTFAPTTPPVTTTTPTAIVQVVEEAPVQQGVGVEVESPVFELATVDPAAAQPELPTAQVEAPAAVEQVGSEQAAADDLTSLNVAVSSESNYVLLNSSKSENALTYETATNKFDFSFTSYNGQFSTEEISALDVLVRKNPWLLQYVPANINFVKIAADSSQSQYVIASHEDYVQANVAAISGEETEILIKSLLAANKFSQENLGQNKLATAFYHMFYLGKAGVPGSYFAVEPNQVFTENALVEDFGSTNLVNQSERDLALSLYWFIQDPEFLKTNYPYRYHFLQAASKGVDPLSVVYVTQDGLLAPDRPLLVESENVLDFTDISFDQLPTDLQRKNLTYKDVVERVAAEQSVPVAIIVGVMQRESGAFDNRSTVVSTDGYSTVGLMQIRPGDGPQPLSGRPSTKALFDPYTNVSTGARILKAIYDNPSLGNGNWRDTLALYNAGSWELLMSKDIHAQGGFNYADDIINLMASYQPSYSVFGVPLFQASGSLFGSTILPAMLPNFSILYQNAQSWHKNLHLLPNFLPVWMRDGVHRFLQYLIKNESLISINISIINDNFDLKEPSLYPSTEPNLPPPLTQNSRSRFTEFFQQLMSRSSTVVSSRFKNLTTRISLALDSENKQNENTEVDKKVVPTPTPTPLPPTPVPDKQPTKSLRERILDGFYKFAGSKYPSIFGLLVFDLITRAEELVVYSLQTNEYKNDLPPYNPESEESVYLASLGVYQDYVCVEGDAYLQDLTQADNNLTQVGSCSNGCFRGACLASPGQECASNSHVYADLYSKCLLICQDGKLQKSSTCGRVAVGAYSDKAYWEVHQSLSVLPEDLLNNFRSHIYASWQPHLEDGQTIAFAASHMVNMSPVMISGGYSASQEVVVHEFFHLYGGHQYRWYPDWMPFSLLINIPSMIFQINHGGGEISVPKEYAEMLEFKVEKYVEYNHQDNVFSYSLNSYPVVDYGGFEPQQIEISEDFADSASWYVVRPCLLKSLSPIRYDYFKEKVFSGVEYLPAAGCDS